MHEGKNGGMEVGIQNIKKKKKKLFSFVLREKNGS